jgi:hypothetical protein
MSKRAFVACQNGAQRRSLLRPPKRKFLRRKSPQGLARALLFFVNVICEKPAAEKSGEPLSGFWE